MAIVRWEPMDDVVRLRDSLAHLLDDRFSPFFESRAFPVDILETPEEFQIEAVLPGVKPEDIHITATVDRLTIQARTEEKTKVQKGSYLRQERTFGEMTRVISLPVDIQPEKVTSVYEHGVLKLAAPKAESSKPRQITVQVKGTK